MVIRCLIKLLVLAGPRSAKAIADAGLALLPDTFITTLRGQSSFDAFVAASELPKVVLASSKSKPTALYKSLSLIFKGQMAFAVVSSCLSGPREHEHFLAGVPFDISHWRKCANDNDVAR